MCFLGRLHISFFLPSFLSFFLSIPLPTPESWHPAGKSSLDLTGRVKWLVYNSARILAKHDSDDGCVLLGFLSGVFTGRITAYIHNILHTVPQHECPSNCQVLSYLNFSSFHGDEHVPNFRRYPSSLRTSHGAELPDNLRLTHSFAPHFLSTRKDRTATQSHSIYGHSGTFFSLLWHLSSLHPLDVIPALDGYDPGHIENPLSLENPIQYPRWSNQ